MFTDGKKQWMIEKASRRSPKAAAASPRAFFSEAPL
jgi:hypothetical protein